MQGVTEGYKGLQGITRGYRGLQGVTEGYKGLQGITRGYKGLQGVTRGDRQYQMVTDDCRGVAMGYRVVNNYNLKLFTCTSLTQQKLISRLGVGNHT